MQHDFKINNYLKSAPRPPQAPTPVLSDIQKPVLPPQPQVLGAASEAPTGSLPPRPPKGWFAKKWHWIGGSVIGLAVIAGAWYFLSHYTVTPKQSVTAPATQQSTSDSSQPQPIAQHVDGLQLDPNKNYGNKYASGVVPVGDNHYVTDAAKQGYIYICHANFVPAGQAGAQARGPWFTNNNTEYNLNQKVHVSGSATWQSALSNNVNGPLRTITTNDLPTHVTGIYPVATSDAAYQFDRNPNSIKSQALTYALNANPTYGSPHCMGGEVGIMLTGVALFDGFDAGGRDAGAWEVQDGCNGHPQDKGEYHYHTLSSCISNTNVDTVIGFALDGFPITGPKISANNLLTTSDLDECHGITSQITLDGKKVTMYHYVMTQDFPYSVSCFRSQPIQAPGLPEGSSTTQTTQRPGMPPR